VFFEQISAFSFGVDCLLPIVTMNEATIRNHITGGTLCGSAAARCRSRQRFTCMSPNVYARRGALSHRSQELLVWWRSQWRQIGQGTQSQLTA